jgi:ABC-type cobalamin transport system ATPase subunit
VSPYAIDSVLRIIHTLVLSTAGGFLLHASSAVRAGRAFLFAGPSGAGKSTIAALAPSDATVLTDEISYVKWTGEGYMAFGTPFAGELRDAGQPLRAPITALFTLARGDANRQERLDQPSAVRALMRNILFFADDRDLVNRVSRSRRCWCSLSVPSFLSV